MRILATYKRLVYKPISLHGVVLGLKIETGLQDVEVYILPVGQAEDNGWIISVCYNARLHTSECVVLCAADMTLLARLALKHALPHGLHGAWDPECHLSGSCRVSS